MASVFDVAAYILRKSGRMTAMKLQKLVYYSQAWSLVWDDAPLFDQPIEAWANGPVCVPLWYAHHGQYVVSGVSKGDPGSLDKDQRETVDAVLKHYGHRNLQYLIDLTHMEKPWIEARGDTPAGHRSNAEISHAAMAKGGLNKSTPNKKAAVKAPWTDFEAA